MNYSILRSSTYNTGELAKKAQRSTDYCYGRAPTDEEKRQSELKSTAAQKISNLYGGETTDYNSIMRRVNPFLKKDGTIINKYADYQKLLDSDYVGDTAKSFIEQATGLKRKAANQSTESTKNSVFASANTAVDAGNLVKMDVTLMPKLNTDQIASVISKYFGKSTVITPSDARGIYDAQNSTGMSALAILGIGALESGYGTSRIAKAKNNIWGWGAVNKNPSAAAKTFSQMSEGAAQFAKSYMDTYYNKYGAKSVYDAGTGNNPAGKGYAYYDSGGIDASWADKVGSIMQRFYSSVTGSDSAYVSSGAAGGLAAAASKYIGVPYVWGGTSPKGFDCSGLVQYVAKQSGITTHRTSADQYKYDGVKVDKSQLQPGDLLFFDTKGANDGNVSHVGIYAGNGKMIHAPHTGDTVKLADITGSYYTKAFVGAKRL